MITGAILGVVTSIIPALFKVWENKQTFKYQLAMADKQVAARKLDLDYKRDILTETNDLKEVVALIDVDKPFGNPKIDAFRALFRPVTAFAIISIWVLFQLAELFVLMVWVSPPWSTDFLLSDFDKEVIMYVISYYFNSRGMKNRFGK